MTAAVVERARPVAVGAAAVASAVALGVSTSSPGNVRIAFALGACLLAGVVAVRAPLPLLYSLPVWLVALGALRRITTDLVDSASTTDAFLVVGPAAFVLLGGLAVAAGALARRTLLTTATVGLIAVLGLSVLNPAQGGLTVGLAGAGLVVAPMLLFLVGRALVTDRVMRRVLALVVVVAVPAAIYGLFQTFVRFPSWDQHWIDTVGYTALKVKSTVRPFGSFASGQEFGTFVGIALVVVVAFGGRLRWAWSLLAVGLFATAVWYESARGVLVSTIAAVGVVICARAGWSLWRTVAVGAALLASLPWLSAQLAPDRFGDDARSELASHQVEGLTDPFGSESTLPGHVDRAVDGVRAAFHNPIGSGVGSVTGAAGKFGGTVGGTEVDIGNIGVAAGLPGLLVFLVITWLGITRAYRLAAASRDPVALAAVGVLVATFLQWLNGGMYSVIWLPWLLLGWVDSPTRGAARDHSDTDALERVSA